MARAPAAWAPPGEARAAANGGPAAGLEEARSDQDPAHRSKSGGLETPCCGDCKHLSRWKLEHFINIKAEI